MIDLEIEQILDPDPGQHQDPGHHRGQATTQGQGQDLVLHPGQTPYQDL